MAFIRNNELISINEELKIPINIDDDPYPVIIYNNNVLMSNNKLYKILNNELIYVNLDNKSSESYQVGKIFDCCLGNDIIIKTDTTYYIVYYDIDSDASFSSIIDTINNNLSIIKLSYSDDGIFYIDDCNCLYFVMEYENDIYIDTDVMNILWSCFDNTDVEIIYQKKNLRIMLKMFVSNDRSKELITIECTTNITFPIENMCNGKYTINNGVIYEIRLKYDNDDCDDKLFVHANNIDLNHAYIIDLRNIFWTIYGMTDANDIIKITPNFITSNKTTYVADLIKNNASFSKKRETKSAKIY